MVIKRGRCLEMKSKERRMCSGPQNQRDILKKVKALLNK
jgi:hypothetical protein